MALVDVVDVELPTMIVVSGLAVVVVEVCPSCDLVSRRDAVVVVVRVVRTAALGFSRCRFVRIPAMTASSNSETE